jgi:two-component system cell cycle sensor histidine kinase/response regulator CckA
MSKKILLVDDNRLLLKYMRTLLEKEGHTVETAEDGLSAIDTLSHFTPDFMFIDLIMPKIEGARLCEIVRNMDKMKGCFLVLLSAAVPELDVDHRKLGAHACIAKGAFHVMAEHVLEVIQRRETIDDEILGLAAMQPRQMTRELLTQNSHMKAVLESMDEGIMETYSGRVVSANHAAVTIFSLSRETLLASYLPDLFDGDTRLKIKEMLNSLTREPAEIGVKKPVLLKGRLVTIRVMPVDQEATDIILIRDVTQQKRLEAELQKAQKMEALGTLAGGVAHDFNNLLMGIMANTANMLRMVVPESPLWERVRNIERCVNSGSTLTKQLLGFARGGKYDVQPNSPNDLMERTYRLFKNTRKDITVHKSYQEDPWTIEVDLGQMEHVLLNLYLNAAQAMEKGGDLFLSTENVILDDAFVQAFEVNPGRYVRLTVSDTGVGMDEDSRSRIFEPFYTTKDAGRGTGLGLASAFGIIRNHAGLIDIDSKKGEGSSFNIYLPASAKAIAAAKPAEMPLGEGSERVLLIDDEEYITEAVQTMLEDYGYKVTVAVSGEEAIDIFSKEKERIDLVILDMIMPEMGGGEVFDHLVKIDPDVKVLLSSGYSINGEASAIMERGCSGFIQKPYDANEILIKIKKILKGN